MSFGIGLGAFTDGLLAGRQNMMGLKKMRAEAEQAKANAANTPATGATQAGTATAVDGAAANSIASTPATTQPAQQQQQQQGSGGLWSTLANAFGLNTNPAGAAATGKTQAAAGTAAKAGKSIF